VSEFSEKLEQEIKAHNELHTNIEAGEKQLDAMKEERSARRGRINLLQEFIEAEPDTTGEAEVVPAPDGQPQG